MELKNEFEQRASALVASGFFTSIEDVIDYGLEMVEHDAYVRENRVALEAKMEDGLRSNKIKITPENREQMIEDIMTKIKSNQ